MKMETKRMILFKKQPGFALPVVILIIFALLGLGAVGYYSYETLQEQKEATRDVKINKPELTPSPIPSPTPTEPPEEITDWKTYKNKKAGYQIKIPSDWKIEEYKPPPREDVPEGVSAPELLGLTTFLFPGYSESEARLLISVEWGLSPENHSSLSLLAECKDYPGLRSFHCPSRSGLLETLPEISAELPREFPEWTAYASLPCMFSADVVTTGDALKAYHFLVLHKPGGYPEGEKILKQTLSTFQFIK